MTLKLFPAIVTLHLLGGIGLLALLAVQAELHAPRPLVLPAHLRLPCWLTLLALLQIALGGWVSTNYAVLACQAFPTCQGSWWPAMDFHHGFTLWRDLGATGGRLSCPSGAHRDPLHPPAGGLCGIRRDAGLAWGAAPQRRPRRAAGRHGFRGCWLGWPLVVRLLSGLATSCSTGGAAGRGARPPAAPLSLRRVDGVADARGGALRDAQAPCEIMSETGFPDRCRARPTVAARQFYALTKPRVVQLIVFCAVIGMLLAVPGWLPPWRWRRWPAPSASGWWPPPPPPSTAWSNSTSTRAWRAPPARPRAGRADRPQTLLFSALLCAPAAGCSTWANPLTMWLTLATFVGYAVIYTVVLGR